MAVGTVADSFGLGLDIAVCQLSRVSSSVEFAGSIDGDERALLLLLLLLRLLVVLMLFAFPEGFAKRRSSSALINEAADGLSLSAVEDMSTLKVEGTSWNGLELAVGTSSVVELFRHSAAAAAALLPASVAG